MISIHSLKNKITEIHIVESSLLIEQRRVKVMELPPHGRGVGGFSPSSILGFFEPRGQIISYSGNKMSLSRPSPSTVWIQPTSLSSFVPHCFLASPLC